MLQNAGKDACLRQAGWRYARIWRAQATNDRE